MGVLAVGATILLGFIVSVLAGAWVAGHLRVGFVDVYTEVEIEAPRNTVRAVVSDFDKYADWNPLMVKAQGTAAVGARMDWTSRLAGADRTYNARVDKGRSRTRVHLGRPGLQRGSHWLLG